jgi:hypothetical protein
LILALSVGPCRKGRQAEVAGHELVNEIGASVLLPERLIRGFDQDGPRPATTA